MITQLEHVTEHGLNLDDQVTDIMRPVAHNVEEMVLQAAHSMLLERYKQQGWKVERHPAVLFKTLHGEVHIKSPYLKKDGNVQGLRPMVETIPHLKFSLDHRHLESHFYEAAQELGYTERVRELWVKRYMGGLWANDYERVHVSLANEYQHTKNDRLRCLINHLERFCSCVDCGNCRELGWPVIPIPPSKHELRSNSEPLELRWNSSQ